MESNEFRRPLCILAGAITLIEAEIWAVVAIYSIGVFGCTWSFYNLPNDVTSWSMTYITYFMGGCHTGSDAALLGFNITPPTGAAKALQVWMWIYAIASAVWIPVSVLLMVAATMKLRGKKGAMLYYPWLVLTGIFIILDVAGAVYHTVDIFNTRTPDSYATFAGSTSWASMTTYPSEGLTTWLPSLYVTLYFCRLLVVWIINIILVIFVSKASKAVSAYKSKNIQSSFLTSERNKPWKDNDMNPPAHDQEPKNVGIPTPQPIEPEEAQPWSTGNVKNTEVSRQGSLYRLDKWGIPIEELNPSGNGETVYNQDEDVFPRSPYQPTGRVFDFTGRPVRPESIGDRWQESAPPMASGVQVPPELNKQKPFSYTAGDQPQLMRSVSRSNSKAEYPSIPRPDYTITDRRSASLEFVPNRFKTPSPKRPLQSQNSFESSISVPSSPKKIPPIPPKKPQLYPRSSASVPENSRIAPQARYIPSGAIPSQQQGYYTRQTSQSSDYNINKLY